MKREEAAKLLEMAVPLKTLTQQEFTRFIQAVNMAIKALETEPHWISVTERLPVEYDNPIEFLCTLEHKNDVYYVDLIMWNGSDWENNYTDDNKYSDYGIDKVVAWMPLPEPYKKLSE